MNGRESTLSDVDLSSEIFYPRRESTPPPLGAQDIRLEVAPSVFLNARLYAAPGARANLVMFYGNGEVAADYDEQAPSFARSGARLVVIDYRGYGRSDGAPSLATVLADAGPALEKLVAPFERETAGGEPLPVIVMGRSLGSSCAAELAGRSPPLAAAIIFESGFSDLIGLASRAGLAHVFSEADRDALCPLQKFARSQLPLLVLHAAEDEMIPPDDARAVHAASSARHKQLVIIAGRGHNDLSQAPEYWRAISVFVARVAGDVTSASHGG